ncbi:MAG TPA: ferritin-like protein, partial [Burkholderiaceae bacterium]|nr:ferritin-like protein [Burkholderiaceae bacterium]
MNPPAIPVVDTREQLLHLLAEAAEFEHNLLCCYLYAAFSLKTDGGEGLTAQETATVKRWHEVIMSVAVEEMTHLILVANLTAAIGGRPHFNRPNLPVAPGHHPADFVVELAPFDMDTLDHFIFFERPEGTAIRDSDGFEPETDYVRGARRGAGLMPSAHDYTSIAEFYGSIRSGFRRLTRLMGENVLFVGDSQSQIGPDMARMDGLRTIDSLDSALAAIDTIIVQGEGAHSQSDDSHFARFQEIKEEYELLLEKNAAFVAARPAARNPVMRKPADSAERVHVDSPQAAATLDLANALYNHLLRLLSQSFGRTRHDDATKKQLIDAAVETMSVFAAVSAHLTTQPA